jgi:hypothetical protein
VELARNENKFVRYTLDLNLRDTRSGQVLFPFNANGREGHVTQGEAENRAIRAAEGEIRGAYAGAFNAYLARLVPETR